VTPVIAAENNKLVNEAKDNACEGKDLNDDNLMKNEDDKSGSRLQKPENDNNNNNYEVRNMDIEIKNRNRNDVPIILNNNICISNMSFVFALLVTIAVFAVGYSILNDLSNKYGANYNSNCFWIIIAMYFLNLIVTLTVLAFITACFLYLVKSKNYESLGCFQKLLVLTFAPPHSNAMSDSFNGYTYLLNHF